jgi:hypothetical protein
VTTARALELLRAVPGLEAETPPGVLEAVALEMADRDFQRLLGAVEGVVLNHGVVAPVAWVLSLLTGRGWPEREVRAAVEALLASGDLRAALPLGPGAWVTDPHGGRVTHLVCA